MATIGNTDGGRGSSLLRRQWRALGLLVVECFAAGMFISLVLALAVFVVSTQAQAAPAEAGQGDLHLRLEGGARVAAPLLFTDVHMNISGMTARVQVKQRFVNPTTEWREGVYVFPLPENAAVDHLTMHIGDRLVEGLIKERSEAKRAYEAAKTEGRKSTLVEQERPNMFTTSVANIGPSEEIVVAIEYQQTLRYDNGSFHLRFPLAITPRYVPDAPTASTHDATSGSQATAEIVDALRITPPLAHRHDGDVNPVSIAIELNAGFALSALASAHHPVQIEEKPGNRYRVTLAAGPIPAARDFELTWTPDVGATPSAALFMETKGSKTYALLMALPPTVNGSTPRGPREITYIIDTSGSMDGVSMAQARDALLMALDRLLPGDRFNVIEFNSVTIPLFAAPVDVEPATLARARQFVSGLRARGGTEMLPALAAAFGGDKKAPGIRQVVFLTDGAVGNEDAILRLIQEQVGDRRLFTVGIGPAPNTFFMTKAAQFGRGTFTYIGDVREVKSRMTALFRKLENPALADLSVAWPAGADAWPRVIPDLYVGEPVVVTAQFNANASLDHIRISGRQGGAAWDKALPTGVAATDPGVGVLWARAKIDALMDAGRKGIPEDDVRAAVVDIALTHHLVSKYTSLVAVDTMPTRPAGVDAPTTWVPGTVPQGLTGFAQLPRTATGATLSLVAGGTTLLLAGFIGLWLRRLARDRRGAQAPAAHLQMTGC